MKKIYSILLAVLFTATTWAQSPNEFPGCNVIGRGYNVFGEYANISSIKRYQIFNFSKCSLKNENDYKIPSIIYLESYKNHNIKDIKGSSIQEYSKDLSNKTKLEAKALFFKGSLESNFNYNSSETTKRYYQTKMDLNLQWKISLDDRDISNLISYLDDGFKNDLLNQTPEVIFERYGTHFIASALLGGRIDFSFSQVMTDNFSSSFVEQKIEAKYKLLKGESNNTESTNIGNTESSDNIKLNIVGGNSQYVNDIKDNEQYKIWADGIQAKPTLCDFTDESLLPIWLLATGEKKEILKNYFETEWIKKYPIPVKAEAKELEIVIDKVFIKNSCESEFKSYGEFQLLFFVNGVQVDQTQIAKGVEGTNCIFDKNKFRFNAPTNASESKTIELKLIENDKLENDELTMGDKILIKITYPIDEAILNVNTQKYLYKESSLARYCEANLNYHLRKVE